jgi:hypothetical protein
VGGAGEGEPGGSFMVGGSFMRELTVRMVREKKI